MIAFSFSAKTILDQGSNPVGQELEIYADSRFVELPNPELLTKKQEAAKAPRLLFRLPCRPYFLFRPKNNR